MDLMVGNWMSVKQSEEAIGGEIKLMEEEIVCLKGRRRTKALKAYRRLVRPQLREPIFLRRSE
jgi:hypothetical protein